MANEWVLLHGGALGDLVLSIQLALRATLPGRRERLAVISRTDPGDLSGSAPAIVRRSLEGLSSHWLYATDGGPPPPRLRELLNGRPVMNALGDETGPVHRRLLECGVTGIFSFDPRPRGGAGHITTQWQRDLERQGLAFFTYSDPERYEMSVTPHQALIQLGRKLLRDAGVASDSCILIHPGSGGREKCWPIEGFVAVARRLRSVSRALAFVIGPVEREYWPAASVDALRAEFSVYEPRDCSELAAILATCGVFLSNDSGPAHLAALLGCRTITLFGPTSAETWRPLSRRGIDLQGRPEIGAGWGLDAEAVSTLVVECTVPTG